MFSFCAVVGNFFISLVRRLKVVYFKDKINNNRIINNYLFYSSMGVFQNNISPDINICQDVVIDRNNIGIVP